MPDSPATTPTPDRPRPSPAADVWTTNRLLTWMTSFFLEKKLDSPRLQAEILLEYVLKCDRLALYTNFDRPADAHELGQLRALVARAAKHEPIAYLTGFAYFFGLRLAVNQHTLIPRPSTETIVEYVLQQQPLTPKFPSPDTSPDHLVADSADPTADNSDELPSLRILEIGTGSGCIAIALAKHLPRARIIASDISGAALEVARRNAREHQVADQLEFLEGAFFEPVPPGILFDYVISNPPYISDAEWGDVESNVADYEPTTALRAGRQGMAVLEPLILNVQRYLKPTVGCGLFEMASSQTIPVRRCVEANPELDHNFEILTDLEGHPRIIVCRRPPATERSVEAP